MTMLVIGFVAGLMVGWNVLPQPKWAENLWIAAQTKWRNRK